MTAVSVIILFVICSLGLFFYHSHYVFIKLVPFGVLAALGILLLGSSEMLQIDYLTEGWSDLPGMMICHLVSGQAVDRSESDLEVCQPANCIWPNPGLGAVCYGYCADRPSIGAGI